MFQSVSIISQYNPLFQCFETPEMGPGIFTFSRACLNLFQNISKRLKHSDLVNFLHVSVRFNNFPIQSIVSVFQNTRNGAWHFHLFQSWFQFCFETFRTNETFGLKSIFFMFQSVSIISLYNPFFLCFETPEMEPGIFTFSRVCFNLVWNVSKQLKHSDWSQFSSCFSLFQ